MRPQIRAFVEAAAAALKLDGPVYEFGSYLVAGQEVLADLRPLFPGAQYVGCDMRPGPGVDRIEDLGALTLADATAQTIICCDTLEHVFEARRAVDEMIRVLRPGGTLLIAAPMDFRIHAYPDDYWRLTPSCVAQLLRPLGSTLVGWQGTAVHPHTVFGLGTKDADPKAFLQQSDRCTRLFAQQLQQLDRARPWPARWKQACTGLLQSRGERRKQRDYFRCEFTIQAQAAAAGLNSAADGASSSARIRV
jgi:SAM-dependent methyltransferase